MGVAKEFWDCVWLNGLAGRSAMCSGSGGGARRVHGGGGVGGHLVFGGPALPVPGGPEARRPTSMKILGDFG